jgi:hypothetical protein
MAKAHKEGVQASSAEGVPQGTQAKSQLKWDDSKMQSSYANAVNVVTTVEEVMLFFGTNQTWDPSASKDVTVELTNRIVLNPHAAKRLSTMLQNVLTRYEERFGEIRMG